MKPKLLLLIVSSMLPLVIRAQDAPVGGAVACAPLPTGAVAWWRAESNTVDAIGINDALPNESRVRSLLYMPGKVGTAFRFLPRVPPLGATNYVMIPASTDMDVGGSAGLTLEGWISPGSLIGLQPLAEWNDGGGNIGAGLALNFSTLEAWLGDTSVTPTRRIVARSASGLLATSVWHHVALTFDKASGLAAAFIDGAEVARTNLGAFRPTTQARFYLGFRPSGPEASSSYVGGMDEWTVYSRALSVAELQSIVTAGSAGKCPPPSPLAAAPPADFVGWWRGESNTVDSVDSNHGAAINVLLYTNGVVGKAFELKGGYVRIPAASNLNLGLGPGLTIETWVSPDVPSTFLLGGTREYVGWHSGVVTQGVSLSVTRTGRFPPIPPLPAATSVWRANVPEASGSNHIFISPADLAPLNVWQHVALTYDKSSGLAVLYFNGNPVTRTNLGSFTPKTAADLNLGFQSAIPFPGTASEGLDEVSLYARALSAAEIRAIMLARSAGKAKDPPVILTNPASLRLNEGATAAFTVAAAGNPILKYQWRQNGAALSGATRPILVLTNLHLIQAGAYSVRVTNAFGTALSAEALLTVNRPPVADASATQPQTIAPLQCDATVALDGSKSSDPDGDSLNYAWFKSGATAPFAVGKVAVVTLPPGLNRLILAVDDGLATNSQSFTLEVLTPADATKRLIDLVNSLAARPQPLNATLRAVLASINRMEPVPAMNQLHAFQNKVRTQVAPDDADLARNLTLASQHLADILGVDCNSPRPPAQVAKLDRRPNGRFQMRFHAPPGFVYIVEASTNLLDWEKIGVATDAGAGDFDFEDGNASQTPGRFYRLVVP